MALKVVGAGLGRTGTHSLKLALEQLLGEPCYHMVETFGKPGVMEAWEAADEGRGPDWEEMLAGYGAAVDWPAAAFWRELSERYPDAVVVLSVRSSPEAWWDSMEQTIVAALQSPAGEPEQAERRKIMREMLSRRFTETWWERDAAMDAYVRHADAVRSAIPAERLVEWRPADGWEPLCVGLGRPIPDVPFPRTNAAEEFRSMAGLDG